MGSAGCERHGTQCADLWSVCGVNHTRHCYLASRPDANVWEGGFANVDFVYV